MRGCYGRRRAIRAAREIPLPCVSVPFYLRFEEMSRLPHDAALFPMSRQGWTMGLALEPAPDSFIGKNYEFRVYSRQALSGYRESPQG